MKQDNQNIEPILINDFPPFLKWAGGKRWFVETYFEYLNTEYERFIEPFLGGGAVFFKLCPKNAILGDANSELINAYSVIRDIPNELALVLKQHHEKHSKDHYYAVRSSDPSDKLHSAARFIYLNRTCWNGLYRVNLNGKFNVPIGTKQKVLLDSDDFLGVSSLLKNADLRAVDFESCIDDANSGDLVFVDPPYTVKHNYNGFIKYNEGLFSWDDQIRLKNSVERAIARGAKVLITNAYHESIRELYEGVGEQIKLTRRSTISGKASARGTYDEILIRCF